MPVDLELKNSYQRESIRISNITFANSPSNLIEKTKKQKQKLKLNLHYDYFANNTRNEIKINKLTNTIALKTGIGQISLRFQSVRLKTHRQRGSLFRHTIEA